MADLLSFLPLIGKNPLFGNSLFGPPEAAPGPDAFAAPNPTTIAGMPALPLGTAAGLAGLFALLAKKGYARQAALQGGLLGYNIGNAPIQQAQQRYDKMMQMAIDKGLVEPYQVPPPQPVANQVQWQPAGTGDMAASIPSAAAPLTTTGPAPPAINYGGMRFMPAQTVDYGALFPGVPGVAGIRGRATPEAIVSAGSLGLAQSQEQRQADEAAYLKTQRQGLRQTARQLGIPNWDTSPESVLLGAIQFKQRLSQAPELVQAYNKMRETLPKLGEYEQGQFSVTPEGTTTFSISQPPEAVVKGRIAAEAGRQELQKMQVNLNTAQLEYYKKKAESAGELNNIRNTPEFQAFTLESGALDKQFDDLDKMRQQYVNQTTGEITDANAYRALTQKLVEVSGARDTALTNLRAFAKKKFGTQGEEAATTTPAVTSEQQAQAAAVKPLLDKFYASTSDLPLYNQANKDLYPDASAVYYATTDPAVDMIKREMTGKYSWQLSAEFLADLKQKFGEQVANAALQRWRYNR